MPKKAIALLAALFLAAVSLTLAGPASAQSVQQIERTDYENAPFMVAVPTIPQVLLILSKNIQMFQQAYPGLVDMDGDAIVDTGFNPAVVYTGYFDPYSCYGYKAAYTRKWNNTTWTNGDPNGVFIRIGSSVPDEAVITRPPKLAKYVKAPVSATGVCNPAEGTKVSYNFTGTSEDTDPSRTDWGNYNKTFTFSGNWLNYVTTSRMDAIRKILYGGSRVQPEGVTTYLEPSFVPHDSTAWGTEVMSDERWGCTKATGIAGDPCQFSGTPQSVYYDITKYTPFAKPDFGKAHFFSRTRNRDASAPFQAIRMLPNIDGTATFFYLGSTDSTGARIENIKGRFWDWALSGRPVPDDNLLTANPRRSIRVYRLRVEACGFDKNASGTVINNNVSPTEGCMQYPSGNYRPTGLLQEYGQGGLMSFGLLTGSYNSNIRLQGGIVRNHIGDLDKSVDPQTGNIVNNGMISNMDRLMISGRYIKTYVGWPAGGAYFDNYSWGNPIGEMLFEGVRYFASLTKPDGSEMSPTSSYTNQSDDDKSNGDGARMGVSPITQLTRAASWKSNAWPERPFLRAADCAKPVILLIGDISPTDDGDTAINSNSNDLRQPVLSGLTAAGLPNQFSMSGYLDKISAAEGLSGNYFYAASSTDDCSAKPLTSLTQVKGICPSAPAFAGTYSAAAAAYYAHTHNFSAGANESGIDVYAVTMSSAYPELTFRKGTGGNEKITIMPVSITSKAVGRGLLLSFLNYYILEWHTDKSGNPFSATVQVNFSDAREADDWEMDAIITYRVELLTDAPGLNTTACLFHSSSTNWSCTPHPIEVDPDQRAPVSGILTTLPAKKYYGFQNNYGDIVYDPDTELRDQYITVNPGNVTGLAVYSRIEKHGSSSKMAMGYTISGSTKDGTYLDLSLRYNASDTLPSVYHTPPTCPEAKGAHSSCGQYHETPEQVRTFTFASSGGGSKFLENPLFLAAKYGGFKDPQNTGVPRTAAETNDLRWSTKEPGIPDNYFQATNISELSEQLGAAFQAIAKSVSTGTATASSVSSILGGGVSIQTLFYPEYKPPTGEEAIKWVGNIYGLFVDRFGNLREDTNGNNQLDIVTGEASALDQGDLVVQFVPDPDGGLPILSLRRDIKGDGDLIDAGTVESLEKLKTLWNTSQQLADMQEDTEDRPGAREAKSEASYGRESYAASAQGGRFIMTYYGSMSANPDGSWDQNPVALDNYLFRYDYGGGKNSPTNVRLAELMLQNSALSVGQSYPKTGAKRMYVRGQGQLPLDVETVKAQIKDGGTNKVTASISGPNLMITIERRNNCTAAELVEVINAAADLGIYNGAPIIRASLAAGDKGEWVVPISGAGNETIYDDADRSGDAEALIEYIRGDDKPGWRSRAVPSPWTMNPPPADAKVLCPGDSGGSEDCIVWRMGDIINSKPVIVGAPNSQFDFIYRDTSYAAYKLAQGRRRQVAYVGSNDGMLHAVNLGFFGSLENGAAGYTEAAPADAGFLSPPTEHKLGSELWAFVPPAVLPHLQWLADPEYDHSYYVDLKPQIVDIKNTTGFPVTMPGGNWEKNEWRTVLIGGLRLGGRTIRTKEAEGGNPSQHSYSEFFALDITNPEKAPILLWRFSSAELGLSTSLPAVVSSLSASGNGNEHNWYVVLGSGPTSDRPDGSSISNGKVAYDGSSTQSARLIVLDAFTGQRVHTMTVTDPEEEKSFFNDSFLPIVSQVRSKGTPEAQWDNNVAYFGLTKTLDSGNGQDTGAVYRLQMVDETTGEPFGKVADWRLARLFKTDQPVSQGSLSSRPVTGAVNAARDSRRNTWVLFGTGRMWSKADAQPCMGIGDPGDFDKCQENHEHFIYGLKEPMKYNTTLQQWLMTFEEITDKSKIVDVSTVEVYSNGTIKNFTKADGTVDTGVKSYAALQNAMFSDDSLGYRRKLATWSITGDTGLSAGTQEVCLYQPKIEGLANGQSLATFTTYEPDVNVCNPEGKSYLHVIDTFTGVPAPYMYQMGFLPSDKVNSDSSNPDEATPGRHVTGYINAGRGKSTEAWISGDTIGTNGQDGTPYTLKLPTETALTNAVISWREILDMGFTMEPGQMFQGIEGLDD